MEQEHKPEKDSKVSNDNMKLWDSVCETDPNTTKKVNQRGGFTAICAQAQFKRATTEWGTYGKEWGVKECSYGYGEGEIYLEGVFYYPDGEFQISSDKEFRVGDDNRKKLLTDITTKALSKLGFNADIFEGKFDDNKYIQEMEEKYKPKEFTSEDRIIENDTLYRIRACADLTDLVSITDEMVDTEPKEFNEGTFDDAIVVRQKQIEDGVEVDCKYSFVSVDHALEFRKEAWVALQGAKDKDTLIMWLEQNKHKIDVLDTKLSAAKYKKEGKTTSQGLLIFYNETLTKLGEK